MDRPYKTIADVAREVDRTGACVRWHCRELGIEKIAGRYLLDSANAERVRASIAGIRHGRPRLSD